MREIIGDIVKKNRVFGINSGGDQDIFLEEIKIFYMGKLWR